ncbi:hypothetical protein IMZ31_24110 (plasmid) [Pontibacillus sp. ALD_SL1]|uniref:hypothetical protein n=1 Tax=Pontibacillus sp. ALD_SL1 TaxID=2777185 RepID=UPI001A9630DA|nr:hypothetical protein [Pontibacillus sp. ALD_SL1]QST02537.1 hypothetical protein IMZ31_24110 [Pontibacillus sp. ALD_SL1]
MNPIKQELGEKILEVLNTEDRGFFVDEFVSEIDARYETYTPKQFDETIETLLKKGDMVTVDDRYALRYAVIT